MPRQLTQEELNSHLLQACADGHRDYAALAIDAGADVNAKDTGDWTPLHFAVKAGADTVVAMLVANGADVNAQDDYGNTALHIVAGHNGVDNARLLIEAGADVNATNKFRKTPLHLATNLGDTSVVALLENAIKQRGKGHADRVIKKRQDKGPPQVGG
jgi:ankyrin repeat protein